MDPASRTESRALPLERFRLFESTDVDEAREFVARVFCPHELAPVRPGHRLDARHHNARVHRNASLNYVQYGAEVRIEPGYLRDFYLLQIPLSGGATIRCGAQTVESHPLLASMPSPSEPLSMRWAEGSPHLIVRLDREALRTRLEGLLQSSVDRPLVFSLGVDLTAPSIRGIVGLIDYLRTAIDHGTFAPERGLLAEQAESHLLTALLLAMPHNYSTHLAGDTAERASRPWTVLPRVVRQAQEFMAAHSSLPITLAEVCAHVGVSARSLQLTFREGTGQSPMAWLRDLRLDRVRAELSCQAGAPRWQGAPKVAEIAGRYGFFHLGHFAAHYRARFGEPPSETARRGLRAP
jgi:AraC-like DNA-binding protein